MFARIVDYLSWVFLVAIVGLFIAATFICCNEAHNFYLDCAQ